MIPSISELTADASPTLFQIQFKVIELLPNPLDVFRLHFLESSSKFFLESSIVKDGFSRFSFMGDSAGPHGETIVYNVSTKKTIVEIEPMDINSSSSIHYHQFCMFSKESLIC